MRDLDLDHGELSFYEHPRLSWGSLLPSRGHTRCWNCGRPWWACKPRQVRFSLHKAQFAVCTRCWPRMGPGDRIAAHRWVTWVAQRGAHADKWEAIVERVIEP